MGKDVQVQLCAPARPPVLHLSNPKLHPVLASSKLLNGFAPQVLGLHPGITEFLFLLYLFYYLDRVS